MKSKTILTLFTIVALVGVLTSCKKTQDPNLPAKQVTSQDNGKTVTLLEGQILKIKLGNPGDGGYTFDAPKYDSSMLKLNSHINTPPVNNMNVGDFGTDTWEFSALKSGTAALIITATRGSESPIIIFSGTITVK
ncbi:protease inhibitor I42 family protein [Mucilaginibacter sp. BT774]|uniref:protease inhibitor I42 family protein n=1 Tax=Mucilaginibacter sp. BT774 TaxID=3062276 RepID=UPI00267524EA|nr:protease inhibitor I42 family protein [Mucilaginibacter sp. BT774]MDO3628262.1 protease inhibitor I42 family protein [Mucilaginibacter sp. BT774]